MEIYHSEENYSPWHRNLTTYSAFPDYQETDNSSEISYNQNSSRSPLQYLVVSFGSTVLCGVTVGLVATFFWWIELNVSAYCFSKWDEIPSRIRCQRFIVDTIEGFIVMFWPLVCTVPIASWSTINKAYLFSCCTVFGLLDTSERLLLYFFGKYGLPWKSYFGNVLFLATTCCISYRVARKCKRELGIGNSVILLSLKVDLQFVIGLMYSLLFNYLFLDIYDNAGDFVQLLLTCILVFAFFLPKLLLHHVIVSMDNICTPDDGIMLAVSFLTSTTVVARLAQTKVEDLTYFVVISILHGFSTILDKLLITLRDKIPCSTYQRTSDRKRMRFIRDLQANQSLICMVTETTSLVFSCSVAYVLPYYYQAEDESGDRLDGHYLLNLGVTRIAIAVSIEFVINLVALRIQSHWQIPVIEKWKVRWKSILYVHVIQLFFIIVYYSEYLDNMLIRKYMENTNNTCVGFFKRL